MVVGTGPVNDYHCHPPAPARRGEVWRKGNQAGERNSVIDKGDDVLYFLWFK